MEPIGYVKRLVSVTITSREISPGSDSAGGAFAEVYCRMYRSLVLLAYATTASVPEAEDIAQDACVQLCRAFDRIRMPEAWARRAVISLSTSWVRRRERERMLFAQPTALPAALLPEDGVIVWNALTSLSVRQRQAILLRYEADLSEREIATILGCRPGTVKSLLSRALDTLRKEMEDYA